MSLDCSCFCYLAWHFAWCLFPGFIFLVQLMGNDIYVDELPGGAVGIDELGGLLMDDADEPHVASFGRCKPRHWRTLVHRSLQLSLLKERS